jgi:hypothetical protein
LIKSFRVQGRVVSTLVGTTFGSLVTAPVSKLQLVLVHGVKGDNHAGSRLLDVREREMLSFGLPKGMPIAHLREVSVTSTEEYAEIQQALSLPQPIQQGSLGENLLISGIPDLSRLPAGTMLFFRKAGGEMRTAVVMVWRENTPCVGPGEVIQSQFPGIPGLAQRFPKAAMHRRGVVGMVYSSGFIAPGDQVIAVIPDQVPYASQ